MVFENKNFRYPHTYNGGASQTVFLKYNWLSICKITPSIELTRNNCFGSRKRNTTLRQSKRGKLTTLLLFFDDCAYLILPDEESCYVFLARSNCCEILHSMVFFYKVIINHTSYIGSENKKISLHTRRVNVGRQILVKFSVLKL